VRRAIIFRDLLLARSETFIQAQAESLREFEPVYAGLRRAVPSLPIVPGVVMTTAQGVVAKMAALAYRLTSIAPRFHRALKVKNGSLVHAHFAVDGAAAMRMCRILKLPLVVTLHGYDVTWEDSAFKATLGGRCYLAQRGRLCEEASIFLCVSKSIREKAIARGFPSEKLHVHYTGIDCRQFSPLSRSLRDPGLVLFVGRLVEMKGCEYVIRAMALLQHPGAKLVIVGDGPLRNELESLSSQLSVDVTFTGMQPADAVRDWLARARVFCVPSVTTGKGQAEGLGMVFLEAQAMGTPVVSTSSGGIPEAVIDGETGLLAPERDVPGLATRLDHLLTDDLLWERCSRSGQEHVSIKFDLERQTSRLEEIYTRLCS
jgi:glycosyltransferase involved in cell wall biosynthesis